MTRTGYGEQDDITGVIRVEPQHYVICSVCGKLVPTDPRGDVLDASGRCNECAP